MKTTKRIPKAIAIVFILGLGIVNNMEHKHHVFTKTYYQASQDWEKVEESDTVVTIEKKLSTYTKRLIKTSIQQIISNI